MTHSGARAALSRNADTIGLAVERGPARVIPTAGPGDARAIQNVLIQAFEDRSPKFAFDEKATPFERCLKPILQALKWSGDDRKLIEAMPHLLPVADATVFRGVLSRLGFTTSFAEVSSSRLTSDTLPVLIERGEDLIVVLGRNGDGTLSTFNATSGAMGVEQPRASLEKMLLISPAKAESPARQKTSWFLKSLFHFKKQIGAIGLLALLANFIALATPFYTAAVYNHVVVSKSTETLFYLAAMIALAIGVELRLRHSKAKLIAYVGARFHAALATAALERVVSLPLTRIEQATVASQVSRFRQFEGIRTFFTGHLVNALLDLPFTLLFLLAMATIKGVFVLIPLTLMAAYAAIAVVTMPLSRRNMMMTGAAMSACNTFTVESLSRADTIRKLGAEQIWNERFSALSRDAVLQKFRSNVSDALLQSVAQALPTLAGIATLGIGATMVMNDELSVGGLISIMMLIWRLLMPIQTAFLGMNNISQFVDSIRQVDNLMRIPLENDGAKTSSVKRKYRGEIILDGVSHRFAGQIEPALRNVSLAIPGGQIIGVSGSAGAGKSTLLKLILGLYTPTAGSVFLDRLNAQQLDPRELRTTIGYVEQDPQFFFGTVAQNMLLAEPGATQATMHESLSDAGLPDLGDEFPQGLDTKLFGSSRTSASPGALMRLSLARAYVRNSRIVLLDDPGAYLDQDGDMALLRKLSELRGKATVVLVSNRPSHLRACDRVIRIERGSIAADGSPQSVLDQPSDSKP